MDPAPVPGIEPAESDRHLKEVLATRIPMALGGVYLLRDLEGLPVYVGSSSILRDRIRRHLVSRRTDAVAHFLIDPYQIGVVDIYPVHDLPGRGSAARRRLEALEHIILGRFAEQVVNTKPVPCPDTQPAIPLPVRIDLLSAPMRRLRQECGHRLEVAEGHLDQMRRSIRLYGDATGSMARAITIYERRHAALLGVPDPATAAVG